MLLTDMVVWTEARFSEKDSLFRVRGTTQNSPDITCYHALSALVINKPAFSGRTQSRLLLRNRILFSITYILQESRYI